MVLVSVIIPTYNRAAWVAEAVASVLAQTWRDFELLVVDDGSTDATLKALAPWRERLMYLRTRENRGVAAARNVGAKAAQGRWLVSWIPTTCGSPGSWSARWRILRRTRSCGSARPTRFG